MERVRLLVIATLFSATWWPALPSASARYAETLAPQMLPKVGAAAPELTLEKLLQAKPGEQAGQPSLRGQVVIVEFWATWCSPCLASIAHLNELADKLKDKPIRFISITSEDEAVVRPFLAKRPIKGWVGLDTDDSVFQAYGVTAIPRTAIIDPAGRLVALTHAENVTEEVLTDVLAGKSPNIRSLGKAEVVALNAGGRISDAVLFEATIKAAPRGETGTIRYHRKGFTSEGLGLKALLSTVANVSVHRLVLTFPEPKSAYEVNVKVPGPVHAPEEMDPLLLPMLEKAFGIKVRREVREMEVLVMTAPDGPGPELRPSKFDQEQVAPFRGRLFGQAARLDRLAHTLERSALGGIVLDESKLEGRFDWELAFEPDNKPGLIQLLREKLGLEITPAKRKIEVVVVEKTE